MNLSIKTKINFVIFYFDYQEKINLNQWFCMGIFQCQWNESDGSKKILETRLPVPINLIKIVSSLFNTLSRHFLIWGSSEQLLSV